MSQDHVTRTDWKTFRQLAPDAYDSVLALNKIAEQNGLDKQLLELVKLRASQINGCAFCVQYHIMAAETLGIAADKLNLVVVWREAPIFSGRERAALAWTEALTLVSHGVSDKLSMPKSAPSFPRRNWPISPRQSPPSMSGTGSARPIAGRRRRGGNRRR
jgi:AhpD family alkylhydroperoxidase